MPPEAQKISPHVFEELSLVRKSFAGKEWDPRNQSSTIIGTKAGPTERPASVKSLLPDDLRAKATAASATATETASKAIGKWDGLASVVTSFYYDFSSLQWITDDEAMQAAMDVLFTNFLTAVDANRPEGMESAKAGARHSATDMKHLDGIKSAAKTIAGHVKDMTTATADTNDDDDDEVAAAKAKAAAETLVTAAKSAPAASQDGDPIAALTALVTSLKADVVTALADASAATDVKIASALATADAAKAAGTATALQTTVAAVKAAQAPTAPGGGQTLGTDFAAKTAANLIEPQAASMTAIPQEIDGTGSFVRRARAAAGG